MSLFLVNRYLGEEDGNDNKDSRSQTLLAKLKEKAKERQKHCGSESTPSEENTTPIDLKKKRKMQVVGSSDNVKESDQDEDVIQKKKKKSAVRQQTDIQTPATGGKDMSKDQVKDSPQTPEKSAAAGFPVLGRFSKKNILKVNRVLPQWLAKPDLIHQNIKDNLHPLSEVPLLCAHLLKKLQSNHIQHLFPVQAEVIPAILESSHHGLLMGPGGHRPRDICVSAPTGSGKTLTFVLPVIQALMQRVVCEVRALAVLPTKELAQQVWKVFSTYADGTQLKVVMVAGHKSLAAEEASLSEVRGGQRRSLADIVVATPGRLVDHINKNSSLCLEHLRFLIIDEADRMIDSMHQSWLSQLVKAVYVSKTEANCLFRRPEAVHLTAASLCPAQMPLQKLLFSATLTHNPEKLQQLGLYQPRLFTSAHQVSEPASVPTPTPERFHFPQGLTEYYVPCTLSKKPLVLLHFVTWMKLSPVLCFTNSREAAHRLVLLLQLFGGIKAVEFSSRLSPGERRRTLKEFQQGKIQVLVSTDAAARGIDISAVKCVINYDAPQFVRTYIHRIGRTARAGRAGLAFTFLLQVQEKNFLHMVREAGSPGIQKQMVKPELLKSLEERYEQALRELAGIIKEEKTK
ncbi:ATP-dependent RNA helicase DDX51 [Periophthalmus magnuspinnatus]|uniref:ATP-dependent RNA helicase DDX51 n=1 Tax=Periophthalmus magnuspinnatus TaxID=409849 RepID=UPI00145BCB26|nr:ATP-dependent RNA helicase DDX51 [Periophthalmus magnuspinnatus]